MRNRKNRFFLTITIFFITLIIIYVEKINWEHSKKEGTFIIGMSQANLYEPWRIYMNKEVQQEAKKHSDIKIIFKDAGGDTEKQKKDIEDFVNFGVDLIIVSINDSKQLTTSIKKAYETVPVIVLDRAIEGYDYTLYIGADTRAIGSKAGDLVGELAGNNKYNVIEVQGMLDSSGDKEITSEFKKSLNKYKNVTIDRTIIGNWQKDEVQDKVEEILKEDKNINVIFAHSDYMALGAYNAKLRTNSSNVKIIGVDGLEGREGGMEMVKSGMLDGTFTCKTGGKEAVEYSVKILNKEDDIPKKILLECNKVTKETLKN